MSMSSILKNLFCNHNFHLVNQHQTESEFEMVKRLGYVPTTWSSKKRLLITDYKCSNCGKLKRFKEKL